MNPDNLTTPTETSGSTSKKTWKDTIKEWALFLLIAACIVFPFRIFIAEPYLVDGKSMDPTFATGDYLIIDKLSDRVGNPERNSVIVFKYPGDPKNDPDRNFVVNFFNPGKSFIKRIIGLPDETVVMKDNVLTIINDQNPKGFTLDQSYVVNVCKKSVNNCIDSFEKKLGPDKYFVMGDNRSESFDSRYWGVLNKKYLLGKPILRLLPLSKIGISPGKDSK